MKDFINATINTLRVFHQELKAEYDLVCKDDGSKKPQSGPASSKHVQRPHADCLGVEDMVIDDEDADSESTRADSFLKDIGDPEPMNPDDRTEQNNSGHSKDEAAADGHKGSLQSSAERAYDLMELYELQDPVKFTWNDLRIKDSRKYGSTLTSSQHSPMHTPNTTAIEVLLLGQRNHPPLQDEIDLLQHRPPASTRSTTYSPSVPTPPTQLGVPQLSLNALLSSVFLSTRQDHSHLNPYFMISTDEDPPADIVVDHPSLRHLCLDLMNKALERRLGLFNNYRSALWWCMRCILRAEMARKRALEKGRKLKFAKHRWKYWAVLHNDQKKKLQRSETDNEGESQRTTTLPSGKKIGGAILPIRRVEGG